MILSRRHPRPAAWLGGEIFECNQKPKKKSVCVCVCVGQTEEEGDDTHTHQREREREGVLFKSLFGHFRGKKEKRKPKILFIPRTFFRFPLCHWQPSDSLDESPPIKYIRKWNELITISTFFKSKWRRNNSCINIISIFYTRTGARILFRVHIRLPFLVWSGIRIDDKMIRRRVVFHVRHSHTQKFETPESCHWLPGYYRLELFWMF